ncbi:hypothetical protein AB0C38_01570 [Amycolatopsis sp. NPDC048633]|uniref:hypothetical protein n=1 Tax=Amycolatopsis sp. NPDC048633 TaxID=3157095 RepID=UPI0033EFAC41
MSWQEELRRLDADLAAGRIEPAAHRKQREELLAQASGSTVPSPVPAPLRRPSWHSANPAASAAPAHPITPVHPVTPARTPAQAPPARVEVPWARPPKQAGPRSFQTPATNAVPPIPEYMTTAPSPADITPTRYLAVDGPSGAAAASRFPPIDPGAATPPGQEPEDARGKHRWTDPARSRPTWLFLGLGVLVVLVMIVGVTMWLGSDDEPTGQASPPVVPPSTSASGLLGGIEDRLPKLPGTQNSENSTMSIDRAVELGVFARPTADVLRRNGGSEVVFRGSAVDAGSNLVMVVPMPGPANAESAVEALYTSALSNGFDAVQSDLRTAVAKTGDTQVRATWYTSGGMVVNVGVSQTEKLGDEALTARLGQVLQDLRAVLPPG